MRYALSCFLAAIVAVTGLVSPAPVRAQWAVIDVSNLVENVKQALQAYQQLQQLVRQYQVLKDQAEDLKTSLKAMDIRNLILQFGEGIDPRLGWSALAYAQYLDVDSSDWRDRVMDLLRVHYDIPDRVDLEQLISTNFGANGQQLRNIVDRLERENEPLLDVYHFQAAQRAVQEERQEMLENLTGRMTSLGDKSEVKNLQAIASALALVAKQQEAQIDYLAMSSSQGQVERYQRLSAEYTALQRELNRAAAARRDTMPTESDMGDYRW